LWASNTPPCPFFFSPLISPWTPSPGLPFFLVLPLYGCVTAVQIAFFSLLPPLKFLDKSFPLYFVYTLYNPPFCSLLPGRSGALFRLLPCATLRENLWESPRSFNLFFFFMVWFCHFANRMVEVPSPFVIINPLPVKLGTWLPFSVAFS